MSTKARRQLSSLPSKTRSETTISHPPADTPSLTEDSDEDDSDAEDAPENRLTMSPAEIRVIKRLSARTNVLPIVGHADSLTDEKLEAVKETVRRDLAKSGLGFGVFGPAKPKRTSEGGKEKEADASLTPVSPDKPNGNGNARVSFSQNGHAPGDEEDSGDEDDEAGGDEPEPEPERRSRPVIKLRTGRPSSAATNTNSVRRSRSRQREIMRSELEPVSPDPTDMESVPNVRFSAHIVARADLTESMPFAVITPEVWRRRKASKRKVEGPHRDATTESGHGATTTEDGDRSVSGATSPASPRATKVLPLPYTNGPPEDLKGVFVRKFRWGEIDVLEPTHCDFAALRTAVLSTHLRVLKVHTKEVLYEKYRTEKLLARRATRNIGESEAKKMLEGMCDSSSF